MFGSTELYKKFVVTPTRAEDAAHHTEEYKQAGLPGCVGSMDATHIMLERVEYRLRQNHLGFKMSHTARTCNITVNYRRRILATTTGYPACWNDKTLVLFDDFVVSLNEGQNMQDFTSNLYETNASGNIVMAKYQGPWLIVDNGYLNWPTTVPPIKQTCSRQEIRFSQWLESIRQDVECTFGILKTGIRLNGQEAADKIFLTCCALHNWLVDVDGLDEKWKEGVTSMWEGALGCHHDLCDVEEHLPDAIARLMSPAALRAYDVSGMGIGRGDEIRIHDLPNFADQQTLRIRQKRLYEQQDRTRPRIVKDLSLAYFRSRLIQHFDIVFCRNEIVWPGKRNSQLQQRI